MIYNLFFNQFLLLYNCGNIVPPFGEAKKCLRPAAFGRPADASAGCIKYEDK